MVGCGAGFAFHTSLIDVEFNRVGHVTAAVCSARSGLFEVSAKVFVDCTGDGALCALAEAPFEKGDSDGAMMPATLCSQWAGMNWPAVIAGRDGKDGPYDRERLDKLIARAHKEKRLTRKDIGVGMGYCGRTFGGGNIGHVYDIDGTDERSLTKGLIEGRRTMPEFEDFYRRHMPGYEDIELVATGAILGIRETRRVMGDYVLNVEDFKSRAVFDDEVGRYSYPVDIHARSDSDKDKAEFRRLWAELRYKDGENYGLPYRSLIPRTLDNVLVAGRCLSADRYMQSTVRTMPCCYITGQAAGMAAAIAAETGQATREVDVRALQRRLKSIGAYLPNCQG
jgi:hypothetical protein